MPLSELLLYLLIVGAVMVFNYLTQQAAKRKRRDQATQAEAPAGRETLNDASEHAWGRHPSPAVPVPSDAVTEYEWGRRPLPSVQPPSVPVNYARAPEMPATVLEQERRETRAGHRSEIGPKRQGAEARRLFATREDLRRGVIAMTVLGPCRANEPPDLQAASPPVRR